MASTGTRCTRGAQAYKTDKAKKKILQNIIVGFVLAIYHLPLGRGLMYQMGLYTQGDSLRETNVSKWPSIGGSF